MAEHTEELLKVPQLGAFIDWAWSLKERIAALEAENERISRQRDAILLQARCWAGEAKTQQSITKEVGEILGGIPSWGPIAAEVKKLLDAATPAQEVRQEAVAWRHTLHMELDQKVVVVSESEHQPFGIRGENYDDAYSVTTEPLYTTPQPGPDVRALVEALEHYANCGRSGNVARVALAAHRQAQQGEQHDT